MPLDVYSLKPGAHLEDSCSKLIRLYQEMTETRFFFFFGGGGGGCDFKHSCRTSLLLLKMVRARLQYLELNKKSLLNVG